MGIKTVLSLTLIIILVLIGAFSFPFTPYSIMVAYGIGNPDSYGNVIVYLCIYQWNGSAWILKLNHTTDASFSTRLVANYPVKFTVKWRLNNTLASSEAEAVSYTRVYMNITNGGTIWNNEELNNTSTSSDADYYYGVEEGIWNQTGKPVAGTTYSCSALYQAYY